QLPRAGPADVRDPHQLPAALRPPLLREARRHPGVLAQPPLLSLRIAPGRVEIPRSMKSLFVTGAASAIGAEVMRALQGHVSATALVHRTPLPGDLAWVQAVPGGLDRVDEVRDQVRAADTVLHIAGASHSRDPAAYMAVNAEGTRRLLAC